MAFYSEVELKRMGFRHVGENVKISNKASIYDAQLISIGDNSRIDDFCVVSGRVTIGRNVHIAVFCNLAGGEKGIVMDDFSGFAYGVNAFTQSDDYSGISLTNPTVPDIYKKEMKREIRIGRHVIIGCKSIVFPGVNIAEGCSVGAMSMVTKSTEPWKIYFGIPAKAIKDRKKDMLKCEAEYLNNVE